MRLIDADELIKIIDKTFYTTDKCYLNDLEYGFNNGLNEAIELIENQPTAYDTDKVVEELEEISNDYVRYKPPLNDYESGFEKGVEVGIDKAIDIVKSGCTDK